MKTKIQIKSYFGSVLFEFEKENNSIKDTLEEAVKNKAYLQGAYLQGAYLRGAYLRGAYLQGAYLQGADLQGVYNQYIILPEGELIIWKKLKDSLIAKLQIPAKAKRVNAIGSRKCRFEYAKVIAIYNGKKRVKEGVGLYKENIIYREGEIIRPDSFDNSPLIECSHGIHGFITRQEAVEFQM